MVIGVDIMDLKLAETGQKTQLEELRKQFRLLENEHLHFHFLDSPFPAYKGRNKLRLILQHIMQQSWKQVLLPFRAWRRNCDIVYCSDYFAPYIHLGYQTVQVYHDAFFYESPDHYNAIWLKMFRHLAVPAARRSAYIIAPSNYARQTIHQHTGIPLEKIVRVYVGPRTFPPIEPGTPLPGWLQQLQGKRYLLHVGVFEKRKNLPRLIRAYALLREQHPDILLVLAGKGSGKPKSEDYFNILDTIRELHLEKDVILPGYVPDALLGEVYRRAFLYVFPSLNEGFGVPVLESFRADIPVIAAGNTALPEVGANAILCFDPLDEKDIHRQMKRVVEDDALRKDLIERGAKRFSEFTWEKTTNEIVAVFKRAAEDKKRKAR